MPGLIPIDPKGDKIQRADAVTPIIQSGNVYLPHPFYFPWVDDLVDELCKFPKSKNDDQVDALTLWHYDYHIFSVLCGVFCTFFVHWEPLTLKVKRGIISWVNQKSKLFREKGTFLKITIPFYMKENLVTDLHTEKGWDSLRCSDENTPYSIPRNRDDWARKAEAEFPKRVG